MRAAFYLFLASFAANLYWLLRPLDWRVIPAALVGWYLADFASGVVHMVMDYRPCPKGVGLDVLYFYEGSRESEEYQRLRDETRARISPFDRVVFDFKTHHPRPLALGRRTLLHQIGVTLVTGALPFSLLFNLVNLLWPTPAWLTAGAVSLLIGSTFAQYFHGSLHRQNNPWFVRLMRRGGLLMTPEAHERHHQSLKRDFATNCGWSNSVLNVVFRRLHERGVFKDEGLEPS
jgi:hypothetical protein